MGNGDCVILVPVASVLEPETDASLRVLVSRGYPVRTLRGSSQVDLARSSLATAALRDGFAETFWIDADTVFDPDDVDRIRKLGLPFAAGLYPCKGPKRFAGKFKPNTGKVVFGEGGGLLEVEYVGMGFTHVRREVYVRMAEGLPECSGGYDGNTVVPYFLPMLADDGDRQCYLSEDYSFCLRAYHCGYPPVVDTRIKLGHAGKKTYWWDDLLPDRKRTSLEVEMTLGGEIVPTGNVTEERTMNQNEMIGKLTMDIETAKAQSLWLLNVLNDVALGRTQPGQLSVSLSPNGDGGAVQVSPPSPAMQAAMEERERAVHFYQEHKHLIVARFADGREVIAGDGLGVTGDYASGEGRPTFDNGRITKLSPNGSGQEPA